MTQTNKIAEYIKTAEEEWKEISGWEGLYKVSNTGKVYSIRSKKLLKITITSNGYSRAFLCRGNKSSKRWLHHLVLEEFLEPRNERQCNHIDGDKNNNTLANLEWVSARDNANHRCRDRALPSGVTWCPTGYKSSFIFEKKNVYLGHYKTPEEASAAYRGVLKFIDREGKYER